jgi:hypothetical protein
MCVAVIIVKGCDLAPKPSGLSSFEKAEDAVLAQGRNRSQGKRVSE